MGRLIEVVLLGTFACRWRDGETVAIQSKKARGVLGYLALARDKTAVREEIASLFWSSRGEQQARQSLRQCLSKLRKLFDDEDRDLIRSRGDEVSLDADRFRFDVDAVLRSANASDDEEILCGADQAGGVLLKDHVFGEEPADDWLRDARFRIQTAAQQALFRCAALRRQAGADAEAIDVYTRIIALNPPCEEAHRGLMEIYAELGRRSDALAQFQACEDALTRHLDASVSEATKTLYDELRLSECASPAREAPTLPLPKKPAIAVLAFDNLSADEKQEYLSDGFSEDITTALSQFSALCVIARNSAFAFKGKGLTVPEIGRRLGVHYVLEGSVQSAGEQFRVTAQLIDADQGAHVWSDRYDGTMRDLFAFRDEIVQRIVATTVGRIEADALERAKRKRTDDLDAAENVLRGKYHHHRYTADDSRIAVALFQKAVEQSPRYALAHGWLACATSRARSFELSRAQKFHADDYLKMLDEKKEELKQVATIDTEESECLRLIGEVYLFQRNYDEAERYILRAQQFNPNCDKIAAQVSALRSFMGDPVEGERYARIAIRLNPFHPGFYQFNLGRALMLQERYEEALEPLRIATPQQNRYRAYRAGCHAALGQNEPAKRVCEQILDSDPDFTVSFFSASFLYRDPSVCDRLRELMVSAGLPA